MKTCNGHWRNLKQTNVAINEHLLKSIQINRKSVLNADKSFILIKLIEATATSTKCLKLSVLHQSAGNLAPSSRLNHTKLARI